MEPTQQCPLETCLHPVFRKPLCSKKAGGGGQGVNRSLEYGSEWVPEGQDQRGLVAGAWLLAVITSTGKGLEA